MNRKLVMGLGSLFVFGAAAFLVSGCGPTSNSAQGLTVFTKNCGHPVGDPVGTPCNPSVDYVTQMPGVSVSGSYYGPIPGITPQGSVSLFGSDFNDPNVETQSSSPGQPAFAFINNALAPAQWDLYFTYQQYCGPTNLYYSG